MPDNRTSLGTFAKGFTGNPGGRPAGFAARVRQATADGQEVLDAVLSILRGEMKVKSHLGADAREVVVLPTVRERFDAARWLAERGFGRVRDAEDDDDAVSKLTDEQLLAIVRSELHSRSEKTEGAVEQ